MARRRPISNNDSWILDDAGRIIGVGTNSRTVETLFATNPNVPGEAINEDARGVMAFPSGSGAAASGWGVKNYGDSQLQAGYRLPVAVGNARRLEPPNAALAAALPVSLYRLSSGQVVTDFNPRDWEPRTFTATYYVSKSGNNSNTGLSEAQAVLTIDNALSKIHAAADGDYQLIIDAGYYNRQECWKAITVGGAKNLVVRCRGRVVSACEYEAQTWTLGAAGTYSAARSSTGIIWDKLSLDSRGNYTPLTLAASQAECEATPNSYYSNGTTLYVHRIDGLAPSVANTFVSTYTFNVIPVPNGRTIIYGMTILGGRETLQCAMGANTASDVILVNCEIGYSSTNGLNFNGARYAITQNCRGVGANADLWNYHAGTNSVNPTFAEINNSGFASGINSTDTNNNISSCHEDCRGVRVGCRYSESRGPVINDVGTANVWNVQTLGDTTYTVTGTASAVFATGAGATSYYDECSSGHGAELDVFVQATGAAYARSCLGFEATSGALASY